MRASLSGKAQKNEHVCRPDLRPFSSKIRKAANETAKAEKELLKPADSTRLKLQREIPPKRPLKGQTQNPWKTAFDQGKVTHTL